MVDRQAVTVPSRILAIGVGCRRGCPADAIVALVREALVRETAGPDLAAAALFTITAKRDEPGLHEAAAALGLPLRFLPAAALARVADRILTRSARVAALAGVPSVAEAAALAGAGPDAVLAGPRRARDGATCAVATVPEHTP